MAERTEALLKGIDGVFSISGKAVFRIPEEDLRKSLENPDELPATARFKAIISASGTDLQGDDVVQDGINWDHFMRHGFFNWEHQPGPDNVLGYPIPGTLARTVDAEGNDATEVDGELLLHKPKARETYMTMVALQKAGNPRQIGFSVEGGIRKRDPRNHKRVLESVVRNVAITANPIRSTARVLLVKSWGELEDLAKGEVGYQGEVPLPDLASLSPLLKQSIDGKLARCTAMASKRFPGIKGEKLEKLAKALSVIAEELRKGEEMRKGEELSFSPPEGVRSAARRGLELRRKHGRGGLDAKQASKQGIGSGVVRATNLSSGSKVTLATVKRMHAYFSRHEKDKQGKGYHEGEEGYPSAGLIAWLLWGGDAGKSWAAGIVAKHGDSKSA